MFLFYVTMLLWSSVFKQRKYRKARLKKYQADVELYEAERDLYKSQEKHYTDILNSLSDVCQELDNRVWWYEKHNLPCEGIKAKRDKMQKQLWAAQAKRSAAHIKLMKLERKKENV